MMKFVNSKFYQVLTLIIDLVILNVIGAAVTILSLGTLFVFSLTSVFILTKDLLNNSETQLIKGFFYEIKSNWKFNLKLSLYVLITIILFIIYGFCIYVLIFIFKDGLAGIMLLGLAITLLVFYIIHLVNMFIFNSYFGFSSFSYTFKASMLIMTRRKKIGLIMIIPILISAFLIYIEPLLSIFGIVSALIYFSQFNAKNTYEKLKQEEEERIDNH